MSTEDVIAKLVRTGAELGASALEGNPPDPLRVVRTLLGLGLDLVPVEELRAHLDAEHARRVDAEVDIAEEAKLALK